MSAKSVQTNDENADLGTIFMNLTHEMKTPLSVILGAINLIENDPAYAQNQKIKNNITIAKRNCFRLVRLINNIMDISRAQYSALELNIQTINVSKFVGKIVQLVQPYASAKKHNLTYEACDDELLVNIDLDKIEKAILNLVSNSLKFTPEGGQIKVSVECSEGFVAIIVTDNGPGIPLNIQDIVFERFKQVNSSANQENEGSGLGLYIAKILVEMHNGSISLNAAYKKGSQFIVKLPFEPYKTVVNETSVPDNECCNPRFMNIELSDLHL